MSAIFCLTQVLVGLPAHRRWGRETSRPAMQPVHSQSYSTATRESRMVSKEFKRILEQLVHQHIVDAWHQTCCFFDVFGSTKNEGCKKASSQKRKQTLGSLLLFHDILVTFDMVNLQSTNNKILADFFQMSDREGERETAPCKSFVTHKKTWWEARHHLVELRISWFLSRARQRHANIPHNTTKHDALQASDQKPRRSESWRVTALMGTWMTSLRQCPWLKRLKLLIWGGILPQKSCASNIWARKWMSAACWTLALKIHEDPSFFGIGNTLAIHGTTLCAGKWLKYGWKKETRKVKLVHFTAC